MFLIHALMYIRGFYKFLSELGNVLTFLSFGLANQSQQEKRPFYSTSFTSLPQNSERMEPSNVDRCFHKVLPYRTALIPQLTVVHKYVTQGNLAQSPKPSTSSENCPGYGCVRLWEKDNSFYLVRNRSKARSLVSIIFKQNHSFLWKAGFIFINFGEVQKQNC